MSSKNKYQHFLNNIAPTIGVWIFGLGLFSYTLAKAYALGMTHDESGSFLYWMDFPIFQSFFSDNMWPDANLHWLYVFFMKISVALFGDSELAIRLPSLLAHLGYLFFSWKILNDWMPNRWAVFFGFILLNVNPYLLDFFALARGYGLAIFLIMASLYYFGKWWKENNSNKKYIALSFGAAMAACLANLTSLNYYAALFAIFSLACFHRYFIKKIKATTCPVLIATVSTFILFLLLKKPIAGLRENEKLYYGAKSLYDTGFTLVQNSIYGKKPFGEYSVEIIGAFILFFYAASLTSAILVFIKNKKDKKHQFTLAVSIFPALVLFGTFLQNLLFGTPYLHHRTALFILPLFGLPIAFWFRQLFRPGNHGFKKTIPIFISFLVFLNFYFSANLNRCREWWFDAETKKALQYLEANYGEKNYTLGCHWHYQPTMTFYINTGKIKWDNPPPYDKKIRAEKEYDFYYIQRSDLPKLKADYIVEKEFSFSDFLMKKKELGRMEENK